MSEPFFIEFFNSFFILAEIQPIFANRYGFKY